MLIKQVPIIIVFMFFAKILFAQNTVNYKFVEDSSFAFYQAQNWKKLIDIGIKANKAGISYHYLNARMGIAYYYLEKYYSAIWYLEKSIKNTPENMVLTEYLYYAYLFTNQANKARLLAKNMPSELVEKVNNKNNYGIISIYFEAGPMLNVNNPLFKENNILGKDSIYAQQQAIKNSLFSQIGLQHTIKDNIEIYHGLSYLNQTKVKKVKAVEPRITDSILQLWQGVWPYYRYVLTKQDTSIQYDDNLQQIGYYINAKYTTKTGLIISPALHLLKVSYTPLKVETYTDYYYATGIDTLPSARTMYRFIETDTSFINFATSVNVSKFVKKANLSVFASYSNFNNLKQLQMGTSVACFPFGNADFYTYSSLTFFKQANAKRLLYHQLIGAKVLKKTWIEWFASIGNINHANEQNAFLPYNTGIDINYKTGINVLYELSSKIELSLRYQAMSFDDYILQYRYKPNSYQVETKTINTNYLIHALIGGIKWKL